MVHAIDNQIECTCTYLVDVGHWLFISDHHLGELCPLLRIEPHDVSEQEHVVWGEANLLSVEDDLLELAGLSEALDHLQSMSTSHRTDTNCTYT